MEITRVEGKIVILLPEENIQTQNQKVEIECIINGIFTSLISGLDLTKNILVLQ